MVPSASETPRSHRGWLAYRFMKLQPHEIFYVTGNPPFLGGQEIRRALDDDYAEALRSVYRDRTPGSADLVTYRFERARQEIAKGRAKRGELIATIQFEMAGATKS
jgi:hypothetical protein